MSKLVPPMSVATTLPRPARAARCSLAEMPATGPEWMVCSVLDEGRDLLPVDLGPLAARRAGGESLEPAGVVELVLLAVDPAIAQSHVESLSVVQAVHAAAFLAELQPDP